MQVTKCFKRFLCICLCLIQMAVICAIGVPPAEAAETKTLSPPTLLRLYKADLSVNLSDRLRRRPRGKLRAFFVYAL